MYCCPYDLEATHNVRVDRLTTTGLETTKKKVVFDKALKLVANATSLCVDSALYQMMLLLHIQHVGILINLVLCVMGRMQLVGLKLSIMHHI